MKAITGILLYSVLSTCAVLVISCDAETSTSQLSDSVTAPTSDLGKARYTVSVVPENRVHDLHALSPSELQQHRDDIADGHIAIAQLLAKSEDIGSTHHVVHEIIQSHRKNPLAFALEQRTAILMLQSILSSDRSKEPYLDAISYYTELLVDQGNPSAFVIAPALEALRIEWSDDEVRLAAKRTIDAFERHVENAAKTGMAGIGASNPEIEGLSEAQRAASERALSRLHVLAGK